MLELKETTLVITDCRDINHAIKVIERCKALCTFTDVKLLTSIPTDYEHRVEIQHISSLVHYSIFCLKDLYKYIDTKHLLIVQRDGWILNPESWDDKWYDYDYMGALFNQWPIMGVGGFSFRSKALMESVSNKFPEWDGTNEDAQRLQNKYVTNDYEDTAIAIRLRAQLEKEGFKFATLEDAAMFSQGGNPNNKYYRSHPFSYHGSWRAIDLETGFVGEHIKHDGILPVL